jgi:hypothetical protein
VPLHHIDQIVIKRFKRLGQCYDWCRDPDIQVPLALGEGKCLDGLEGGNEPSLMDPGREDNKSSDLDS